MCEYCEKPNKTICNADAINYCPMCGRKFENVK